MAHFLADRAKQIKVHAKINQNRTDNLIQQLKAENEKLKQMMLTSEPESGPKVMDAKDKAKWEEEMRAIVQENERQMRGE